MEDDPRAAAFARRHGIESALTLTVTEEETAADVAYFLADRIKGKTVVEIGAGIGLLAMHLGRYAERVWAIEALPEWALVYATTLHRFKPKNVTFIFGSAEEMAGTIRADVAVFCTHSAVGQLTELGRRFAPLVIDVYGEVIDRIEAKSGERNPLAAFRDCLRSEWPA